MTTLAFPPFQRTMQLPIITDGRNACKFFIKTCYTSQSACSIKNSTSIRTRKETTMNFACGRKLCRLNVLIINDLAYEFWFILLLRSIHSKYARQRIRDCSAKI